MGGNGSKRKDDYDMASGPSTRTSLKNGLRLDVKEFVESAKRRIRNDQDVVPCTLCHAFHGNTSGNSRGFLTPQHKREWLEAGAAKVKGSRQLLDSWKELDCDFVMRHSSMANVVFPPFHQFKMKVAEEEKAQTSRYQKLWDTVTMAEKAHVLHLDDHFPRAVSMQESKDLARQPDDAYSLRMNYRAGAERMQALFTFTMAIALAFGLDTTEEGITWSVKKPDRIWKKVLDKYPEHSGHGDFTYITDVYRTSLTCETLEHVAEIWKVLECLGRNSLDRQTPLKTLNLTSTKDHFIVERMKNRFRSPAVGGYRDLLANVRINGYVCELQVHYRPFYDLFGNSGRHLAKWFNHFREEDDMLEEETNITCSVKGEHHIGGRYTGDVENGQRHGLGTFYYHTGDRYEGEFHQGVKHGLGIYYYHSGDRYRGAFANDRMHGRGKYFNWNGEIYEGEFKDGMRHGAGIFHHSDGTIVAGDWFKNKRIVREVV